MTPQEEIEKAREATNLLRDAARTILHFRDRDPLVAAVHRVIDGYERMQQGNLTVPEIHNICHNLHGKVTAVEFSDACVEEQRMLYGCAPDRDAIAALTKKVQELTEELALKNWRV